MIKTRCLNGTIRVGDTVVSVPIEDYACLIGVVKEIVPVGAENHDTGNETDDIHVNFENSYGDKRIAEIETMFQELYQDPNKTYEECCLDLIIMAPDMLLKLDISQIGEKQYEVMLNSESATSAWCFEELLQRERIERETVFGTLFAELSGDPDYPGIYVGLFDNEDGIEKTMTLAEATPNHPSDNTHALRLLVWRNMNDMDNYTDDFTFLEVVPEDLSAIVYPAESE